MFVRGLAKGRCMAPDLTSNSVTSSRPPADLPASTGGAMTVAQFCNWASIGRTKLYAEVKAGRIKLRKIGSKSVVLRSEGEAWLHALPTADAV
jgi:hypothetical protein